MAKGKNLAASAAWQGLALACCMGSLSTTAAAATGFLQYGGANAASMSNRALGMGAFTGNPAAGQFLLKSGQSFRAGVLSLPHVGYELGPVDNFMDEVEALQDEMDRTNITTQAEAQAIVDRFNELLRQMGREAYVNLDVQQQVPAMPMAFRAFGGVIALDAAIEGRIGVTILDAPLQTVDNGDGTWDVTTDSAAYLRSATFTRFSGGFSRGLPALDWLPLPEGASLMAGGRLSVIQGRLSKQVLPLDSDGDETAFDRIEENYDANERSTTALGLDAGAILSQSNWHAGVTLYNLLPPKFDFGAVGRNCAAIADPGQQADCEAAAKFAGRIDLTESYTDETRLNVEGGYRIAGSNWVAGGSLDLNAVPSLAGEDFQWLSTSIGYESSRWWVPGATFGYKQNLAGSKLSYATLGLRLFHAMNLNLSYGLESTDVDGSSMPRSAALSLAFEVPL